MDYHKKIKAVMDSVGTKHDFASGEAIVSAGEKADTFFVIKSGLAQVVLNDSDQFPVATLQEGTYIGYEVAYDRPDYERSVIALTDVEVIACHKEQLRKEFSSCNHQVLLLKGLLSEFLKVANDHAPIERILKSNLPGEYKFYFCLLDLARIMGSGSDGIVGREVFLPPLKTILTMYGISRTTAYRACSSSALCDKFTFSAGQDYCLATFRESPERVFEDPGLSYSIQAANVQPLVNHFCGIDIHT